MAKRGRPSKYKDEYAEQVYKLCLLGAVDAEIADFFGIAESNLNQWKKVYPEFQESIKKGKTQADANVADRLYQKAMGYEHDDIELKVITLPGKNAGSEVQEVKVRKYYPPDTTADIFWMCNRQRSKWQNVNKVEHTGKDGKPIEINSLTDEELDAKIKRLLKT
jgi:hypothetical protein